jgi:hypothetical protein
VNKRQLARQGAERVFCEMPEGIRQRFLEEVKDRETGPAEGAIVEAAALEVLAEILLDELAVLEERDD